MRLYLIRRNGSRKVYVGMTSRSLIERFLEHKLVARGGSMTPLHCAMRKYGPDTFTITLLGIADTREELQAMEVVEIARRSCTAPKGYNLTVGGDGQVPGYRPSVNARLKLSIGLQKSWANLSPEDRAERGRKISEAKKGRTRGPNSVPSSTKGRARSEDFKRKVSEGMRRVIAALPEGEMARRGSMRGKKDT